MPRAASRRARGSARCRGRVALPAVARAGLIVGVNDAAALDPTQAGWFYPTLAAEGLQLSTLTLRWDDAAPTTVPDVQQVSSAIAAAAANGVTVELDLFPLHSQVFTGGTALRPLERPAVAAATSAELAGLRGLDGAGRADLPDRARVRRHERVQPAALRQPAVEQRRTEPVGRDLRARARGRLRRAQGARPGRTSSGGSASRRAATTTRTPPATPRPRRSPSCRTSAPGSRPSSPRPGARRR